MESEHAERKNKLASQMGLIIRDVIESLKEISNDMSPHVLVNFGLHAAIKNIINLFSKNIRIHQELNIDNLRFPITVESVVYRIIKELINNTVKHAGASNIYVSLNYTGSRLFCGYRDDGIGFDLQKRSAKQPIGMGINNIISRIQSLGGDHTILTSPGNGFELKLELQTSPLSQNGSQQP
jgi:signal transduction histidine kinase